MRAAVLEAFNEPLKIRNDWKGPEIGPNDGIVKIMANGICRSDWHLWQGDWECDKEGQVWLYLPVFGVSRSFSPGINGAVRHHSNLLEMANAGVGFQ